MKKITIVLAAVIAAVVLSGCICTNTPEAEQAWWEYSEHWGADGNGNWPFYAYIIIIVMYPAIWLFS